jgi:hypothetical protein
MVMPFRLVGYHDHHFSNVADAQPIPGDTDEDGYVFTLLGGKPIWAPPSGGGGTVPNGGTTGQVLAKDSGADGDFDWHDIEDLATAEMDDTLVLAPDGAGGVEFRAETGGGGGSSYYAHRVWVSNALTTFNVNNTSYVTSIAFEFNVDLDEFPFADFRIVLVGQSNAAGQTIAAQLATVSSPGTAIHTGGNDIASIPNAQALYDSGWRSRDDGATGLKGYAVAFKGSNSTVDMQVFYIDVLLRI